MISSAQKTSIDFIAAAEAGDLERVKSLFPGVGLRGATLLRAAQAAAAKPANAPVLEFFIDQPNISDITLANALFSAVQHSNEHAVSLLLSKKPTLHASSDQAIILAAGIGHHPIVRALLDRPHDIESPKGSLSAALAAAIESKDFETTDRPVMAMIVDRYTKLGGAGALMATPKPLCAMANRGNQGMLAKWLNQATQGAAQAALRIAITTAPPSTLRMLAHRAAPENPENLTARICDAAALGRVEAIQVLVDAGYSYDADAVIMAAMNATKDEAFDPEVMKFVWSRTDPCDRPKVFAAALRTAVNKNEQGAVDWLLSAPGAHGSVAPALHAAITNAKTEMVRSLVGRARVTPTLLKLTARHAREGLAVAQLVIAVAKPSLLESERTAMNKSAPKYLRAELMAALDHAVLESVKPQTPKRSGARVTL